MRVWTDFDEGLERSHGRSEGAKTERETVRVCVENDDSGLGINR